MLKNIHLLDGGQEHNGVWEAVSFFSPLLCVFYECTWLDDLHSSAGKSMRNDRDCTLLIHRLLRSPFLLFCCCFFKLRWKCSFTSRKSASIEGSLLFQLLKAHDTRQVACFSRSMYELSSIAIGRKRKKKKKKTASQDPFQDQWRIIADPIIVVVRW